MSTTLIIILAVLVALVGLITFNFYRMKNAKPVKDSEKIIQLGKKNFNPHYSSRLQFKDLHKIFAGIWIFVMDFGV